MDPKLEQILGAPEGVIYNLSTGYFPPPKNWTPDWIAFDQHYFQVEEEQEQRGESRHLPATLSITDIINLVLAIETIPVPIDIIPRLLIYSSPPTCKRRTTINKINTNTFENAAQNNKTCQLIFQYLINHCVQWKTMTVFELHATLSKCLHICAAYNSIDVAKAIIEYYPNALNDMNVMGFRPIHSAFSYQNQSEKRSGIVQLLIEEGVKYNIGGESGCGGIFLQREGSAYRLGARSGGSPIELALYYLRKHYNKGSEDDCEDEWACLTSCYNAMMSNKPNIPLINYIISMQIIALEPLIPDIVKRYNINLNVTDKNGMTALLVAIREKKLTYIQILLSIHNNANVKVDCVMNGRQYKNCLPLHIALNESMTWDEGLKDIYEKYSDATALIDPSTGMYSFMIAAKNDSLNTVYELLRCNPGVVDFCVVNKNYQHYEKVLNFKATLTIHYHHFIIGVVISILFYVLNTMYVNGYW